MSRLSPTMAAVLQFMNSNGGTLLRREGGYWTPVGKDHTPNANDYAGTSTLRSLESRGLVSINWNGTPSATTTATGATP